MHLFSTLSWHFFDCDNGVSLFTEGKLTACPIGAYFWHTLTVKVRLFLGVYSNLAMFLQPLTVVLLIEKEYLLYDEVTLSALNQNFLQFIWKDASSVK